MIEFSCFQCGNELKVDDSKAGARGKCPKCSSIIVVPHVSTPSNQLIFVDDDNFFSDNHLNGLYKQFLETRKNLIYSHQVSTEKWGDSARFEIAITNTRTQIVWLMNINTEEGESLVCFFSFVGEITLKDSAVHALRSVEPFAPYSIRLDESNRLVLTAAVKSKNLDIDYFDRTFLLVAVKADELEEALFGVDAL